MLVKTRSAAITILLVLGYATLLSGGHAPATNWQLGIVICQTLLLTFLTCYVGRSAIYVHGQNGTSEPELTVDEMLSDGIQQLPCALLLVDAKSQRLQFANHAAFKLFGIEWLPDSQLSQRHIDELFRFTVGDEYQPLANTTILEAVARREQQVCRDLHIKRATGESKKVLVRSIPLFNKRGDCASLLILVEDMTEHYRQLKHIEDIAYCDPLTGLANRLSILQRIQESFDRLDSSHFALLFMDFDRFKLINDSLGHDVGDLLLVEIGKRINQSIRSSDYISVPARLGGDEFVVLLDRLSDPNDATQIAERILKAVNQPYHLSGHTIVSSASIGVVTSSHGPESASDMLRKADLAMYKSKAAGKARCSMFDESLKRQVEQRMLLENELRSAIKFDEFDFDIQPIVNLATRERVGGEALLRWQHPRLGRVAAGQFMEVACESGVIVPIGDQLLMKAARLVQSLSTQGQPWQLHINISRLQLLLPQLLDGLDATLQETGIEPASLVFEVAETSIHGELDRIADRCRELKKRGIKLCLDNFGAGSTSLLLLRTLPLDCLKLDRSIVQGVNTNPENLVLLEAFLTIAKNYNIQVIAEGIECESQRAKLLDLGCEFGQGLALQAPVQSSRFHLSNTAHDQTVLV